MEHDIKIYAFSTDVDDVPFLIGKVNKISGSSCVIQLLNADGIAGAKHILHATHQAIHAFKRKENIASDLGLEICVRASAQRQITKALDILGLKEGFNKICAVLVDCDTKVANELKQILEKRDDDVLEADINYLKNIYNISDAEIETSGDITKVMMERTSLLVLET